jgi:hypothetical protein
MSRPCVRLDGRMTSLPMRYRDENIDDLLESALWNPDQCGRTHRHRHRGKARRIDAAGRGTPPSRRRRTISGDGPRIRRRRRVSRRRAPPICPPAGPTWVRREGPCCVLCSPLGGRRVGSRHPVRHRISKERRETLDGDLGCSPKIGSPALSVKPGQSREEPPTKPWEDQGASSRGRPQIMQSAGEPIIRTGQTEANRHRPSRGGLFDLSTMRRRIETGSSVGDCRAVAALR